MPVPSWATTALLAALVAGAGYVGGRCHGERLEGEAIAQADRVLAERDSFAELFRLADAERLRLMALADATHDTVIDRDTVYLGSAAAAQQVRTLLKTVTTVRDSITVLLRLDSTNVVALRAADSLRVAQMRETARLRAVIAADSVAIRQRDGRIASLDSALTKLRKEARTPPTLLARVATAAVTVAAWEFVLEPQVVDRLREDTP